MKVLGIFKRHGRTWVAGSGTYKEVKSLNTKEDYQKLIIAYKKLQARKHNNQKKGT